MISSKWYWNQVLAPDISNYFEFSAWQRLQQNSFSPGGVVQQLITLSVSPVFFIIEKRRVLACITTEAISNAINAGFAVDATVDALFQPGEKENGRWPVSSPGVTFPVTSDLTLADVRRWVLAPKDPSFTSSTIINAIADFAAYRPIHWLITLDQISGDVRYFERPLADPVALITSSGGTVRIAVETP